MIKLAPSVLGADIRNWGEQVALVEQAGAQYLHLDIMDGNFVPNISFGADFVKGLRPYSKLFFDVHLMIAHPDQYLADFVQAGADSLTVHVETCPHLHRTIQAIKSLGVQAGVALNPGTPLNCLEEILPDLDMVLLMSVNPGFCGQKFIPASLNKVQRLRQQIQELGLSTDIQIDGGVGLANVEQVVKSGANILVAGSAVFGAADVAQAVKEMLIKAQQAEG